MGNSELLEPQAEAGVRIRADYWYQDSGIWLAVNEARGTLRIGLADDRQHGIGPIRSVDFSEAGMSVDVGDDLASLATNGDDFSLPSPVAGIIVALNRRLLHDPLLINVDPYGAGWLIELRPARWPLVGFHDAKSYRRQLDGRSGVKFHDSQPTQGGRAGCAVMSEFLSGTSNRRGC